MMILDFPPVFKMVTMDPGLNNIGLAIWEIENTQELSILSVSAVTLREQTVVDDQCYDPELIDQQFIKRMRMTEAVMKFIRHDTPSVFVSEMPFFNPLMPSSFAILTEVVSGIFTEIRKFDNMIQIVGFSPKAVKKTLGVAGIKGKDVVKDALRGKQEFTDVLVEDFEKLSEHAIDAGAVGLTYLEMKREDYQRPE